MARIPRTLYHVTLAGRLESIARSGLVGYTPPTWGTYAAHSEGRNFLTEDPAFWWDKIYYVHGGADTPEEIPVILRVHTEKLNRRRIRPDDIANAEFLTDDNWWTRETIPPEAIRWWNGRRWAELDPPFDVEWLFRIVEEDGDEYMEAIEPKPERYLPRRKKAQTAKPKLPDHPVPDDIIVKPGPRGFEMWRVREPEPIFMAGGYRRVEDAVANAERVASGWGRRVFVEE